jgi:hypothetical protein
MYVVTYQNMFSTAHCDFSFSAYFIMPSTHSSSEGVADDSSLGYLLSKRKLEGTALYPTNIFLPLD